MKRVKCKRLATGQQGRGCPGGMTDISLNVDPLEKAPVSLETFYYMAFANKTVLCACKHLHCMPSASIHQLCLQIAESDEAAFGELFKLHYARLLLFAEAILKCREPAEEAVEDVFLKLWENRKVLPAINNLNYYLLVAVKHRALDYLEKTKNYTVISLDDVAVEFGELHVNPETTLISAESIRIIRSVINDLPPRCKLIFHLVKEEGLKYREAADLLNISIKTVETQISLALSKIGLALQTRLPSETGRYQAKRTRK